MKEKEKEKEKEKREREREKEIKTATKDGKIKQKEKSKKRSLYSEISPNNFEGGHFCLRGVVRAGGMAGGEKRGRGWVWGGSGVL